jgi:hypothetical protein
VYPGQLAVLFPTDLELAEWLEKHKDFCNDTFKPITVESLRRIGYMLESYPDISTLTMDLDFTINWDMLNISAGQDFAHFVTFVGHLQPLYLVTLMEHNKETDIDVDGLV